jgi:hypothetical protein
LNFCLKHETTINEFDVPSSMFLYKIIHRSRPYHIHATPSHTVSINLDDSEFEIQENLFLALKHVRTDMPPMLWVDVLCLYLDRCRIKHRGNLRFVPLFSEGCTRARRVQEYSTGLLGHEGGIPGLRGHENRQGKFSCLAGCR